MNEIPKNREKTEGIFIVSTGGLQPLRRKDAEKEQRRTRERDQKSGMKGRKVMVSWKPSQENDSKKKDQWSKDDRTSKVRIDYSPWILVRWGVTGDHQESSFSRIVDWRVILYWPWNRPFSQVFVQTASIKLISSPWSQMEFCWLP